MCISRHGPRRTQEILSRVIVPIYYLYIHRKKFLYLLSADKLIFLLILCRRLCVPVISSVKIRAARYAQIIFFRKFDESLRLCRILIRMVTLETADPLRFELPDDLFDIRVKFFRTGITYMPRLYRICLLYTSSSYLQSLSFHLCHRLRCYIAIGMFFI